VLVLSLATVAGCGGGNDNNSSSNAGTTATTSTTPTTTTKPSGGGGNIKISADPSGALKFDKSSLSAKSGKVTIKMDNPSPVEHAVAIEGNGVDVDGDTVGKGGVSTVAANLKPGKYTFYCPVDGHKDAGMKGTLTIK
jgi:uncharacterized cupredoxin-like copper-binding protein